MAKKSSENRRDFLKKTFIGSAGIVAAESLLSPAFSKESTQQKRGIEINPKINNLRVVYVKDTEMLANGTSTSFGKFSSANGKVNAAKVKANMNKMACALANNPDPKAAWGTIFQKPAAKDWGDLKIAIKPNCAAGSSDGQNYPHAVYAIINSVCEALIDLGAKGSNMTIYDTNGFSVNPSRLYPRSQMVDGIKFLGPKTRTYPTPMWKEVPEVAITADILINIASCKGHAQLGGATLCLKNHLGTVGGHVSGSRGVDKMINIHNSKAVLGSPVQGSVPPKQQLAIIDCLWTAKNGPTRAPDKAPCTIVMGTSCSAVDCFTAIKLRRETYNYGGTRSTFVTYLTKYDSSYTSALVEKLVANPSPAPDEEGRGWLNVDDWTPTPITYTQKVGRTKEVSFFTSRNGKIRFGTGISLKNGEKISEINIYNVKGTLVRSISNFSLNSKRNSITWDSKNSSGKRVPLGTYVVTLKGQKNSYASKLVLKN